MKYVRFGELYKIPSCNGLSRPSAVRGEGYKMVNMGELFSNDIINDMYMERVQMSERELKKFLLENGDLLFARQSLVASGAGKCSIVNNLTEKTTFESHLIRVRLDESIANPLYYYYLFQLPYNPVKTIVNQCAQAGIRGTELVRIKVPLPAIEHQNTIANALFQYDKLIENNNKRIRLLEQMAENLYKEWFVRFRFPGYEDVEIKNDIPKNWSTRKLKDIVKKSGKSIKRENLTENLKYVPIDCIDSKTMVLLKNDDLENASSSLQTFKTNDILFGAMRPYFHKVSLSHFVGVTRTTCFVIAPKKKEYKYFLYLLLFQEATVNFATTISVGSTMPYVRWEDFIRMNVVVPDIETAKKFSMEIDPLMKTMQNLSEINKLLARQRDMLLPRLMSGKLEV
ncbi:restriction endonuclease subunit S [Holdemanella biformis]|uniref:restriction endonuclease subunit S n=1 Tax=Holdemanella biformis TaxID=1735 RepID=UPI0022E37C5A|nr:restriction endonuclease subunit S [Holdemanella biformis]